MTRVIFLLALAVATITALPAQEIQFVEVESAPNSDCDKRQRSE